MNTLPMVLVSDIDSDSVVESLDLLSKISPLLDLSSSNRITTIRIRFSNLQEKIQLFKILVFRLQKNNFFKNKSKMRQNNKLISLPVTKVQLN